MICFVIVHEICRCSYIDSCFSSILVFVVSQIVLVSFIMVLPTDTLADQCAAMEETLVKLQPRLRITHMCVPIKAGASNLAKSCSICSCGLAKGEGHLIVLKQVDYEELEISTLPSQTVCQSCRTVSCMSELMTIYLSETIVSNEETSSQLSTLVDHFLRVNGQEDVSIFNAAISLAVSLRKSLDRLALTTVSA